MIMGKYFLHIIVLSLCCTAASGQDLGRVKSRLMQSDSLGARVAIVELGSAADIIRNLRSPDPGQKINGYRIRLFSDKSSSARAVADAVVKNFRESYPDIPVKMEWDEPYFMVFAGYFRTREDAISLWGRVKPSFKDAFIVPGEFPMYYISEQDEE